MRQLTIEEIKHKIDTDQYFAVSVFKASGERVYTNKLSTEIRAEFGNGENFIKHLFSTYNWVKIQVKRKNGSSFKTISEEVFSNSTDNYPVATAPVIQPGISLNPHGLGAPTFGLSGHEYVRLSVAEAKARELEKELEILKPELKRLQQIEREFEIYKIQDSKSEAKSKANTELIQTLVQNLPALGTALAGFVQKAPALGTPRNDEDQFIKAYRALPQDAKNFFYRIYELTLYDAAFLDEIADVVNKYSEILEKTSNTK